MDRISSTNSSTITQVAREPRVRSDEPPRIQFQRLTPQQRAQLSKYSQEAFSSIQEIRGSLNLPPLEPLEPLKTGQGTDSLRGIDWLEKQLKSNPEAAKAFERLTSEQKNSFLKVAVAATPPNQPLNFGLFSLLTDGKLKSKDHKGETLLANLERLAGQKTAKGFSPKSLLASALAQITTHSGGSGTIQRLARERPAEYVRLLRGLASPEGKVKLAGGEEIQRPEKLLPVGPFGSSADQLLRSGFGQLADKAKLPEGEDRHKVLLEVLKRDTEAWKAFQKLKPEQQQKFLKLLDSDGYHKERAVSAHNCMDPPPLNDALLQLLKSGKLLSKDSKGTTLLDNLEKTKQMKPPEGMTSDRILGEVLFRLTRPTGLTGGGMMGGAFRAGPLDKLAQGQPSEYVRLALGLLGPEGKVELANGQVMEQVVPKARGGMLGGLGMGVPGVHARLSSSLEAHLDKPGSSSEEGHESVREALKAHPKSNEAFQKLTPEQQEQFLALALRSPSGRAHRAEGLIGLKTDAVALNPGLLKLLESGKLTQQDSQKNTLLENLGKIKSDRRLDEALGLLADPAKNTGWQIGGLEQQLLREPAEFARRVAELPEDDSHRSLIDPMREGELAQHTQQSKTFSFTNSAGQRFEAQVTELAPQGDKRKFKVRLEGNTLELTVPKDFKPFNLVGKILDYWSQQPAHLRGELKTFKVESGPNPADAYWAEKYGMPGFRSAATAGGHEITMWNGGHHLTKGLFDHEFGHLVGSKDDNPALGDADFCPPGWEKAIKADGRSVSGYGDKAIAEDFAEAWKHYIIARNEGQQALREFRLSYPNRSKILDEIWENRDKPGGLHDLLKLGGPIFGMTTSGQEHSRQNQE